MAAHKYPIGLQTFSKIIKEGYTYIDKTAFIKSLLEQGQFLFLSRPRRFGKSLLLSTLEAYFEGRRELFKGLAIDGMDMDWTPHPVLHFDFNAENYTLEDGLERNLQIQLDRFEAIYGRNPRYTTPAQRFSHLIQAAYEKIGRGVVVLVDEYDKPLLSIEHKEELLEKNQSILKSFFGNLKTMDRYLRFVFITGVARFSKVSIFSDFNNLDDISLQNDFADICGWTEEELVDSFHSGIQTLAEEIGENYDAALAALRYYYDGYRFTARGSRLYNPFSVLRALKAREIDPFWYETGTPTFLVRRFKEMGILPADLQSQKCSREDLRCVGLQDRNPIPLMFQTGYLTIDSYNKDTRLYTLRFPNREVELGFYRNLLPVYVPDVELSTSPLSLVHFKEDLYEGRPDDFMNRLKILLKNLPGEDHCESAYRAITYLLAVLCNTFAIAEHDIYKGRSDLEVFTPRYIYLFEFKYNRSVREAMSQIYSRDYAGRYELNVRTVYLIGANFSDTSNSRGLSYAIEKMTNLP